MPIPAPTALGRHPEDVVPMVALSVLALDLEGTLISNAVSQIPRPGLNAFLSRCRELFPRLVMFTTVEEERFRAIAAMLAAEGAAPSWFPKLEYVQWEGQTKDLRFIDGIEPNNALLVDDFRGYVHPGQEDFWMPVEQFAYPYSDTDRVLMAVIQALEARVRPII